MRGRYALYGPAPRIREEFDQFDLDDGFDFVPRYNTAPNNEGADRSFRIIRREGR